MLNLIPLPAAVTVADGKFALTVDAVIRIDDDEPDLVRTGEMLASQLRRVTGFRCPVLGTGDAAERGSITLAIAGGDSQSAS